MQGHLGAPQKKNDICGRAGGGISCRYDENKRETENPRSENQIWGEGGTARLTIGFPPPSPTTAGELCVLTILKPRGVGRRSAAATGGRPLAGWERISDRISVGNNCGRHLLGYISHHHPPRLERRRAPRLVGGAHRLPRCPVLMESRSSATVASVPGAAASLPLPRKDLGSVDERCKTGRGERGGGRRCQHTPCSALSCPRCPSPSPHIAPLSAPPLFTPGGSGRLRSRWLCLR